MNSHYPKTIKDILSMRHVFEAKLPPATFILSKIFWKFDIEGPIRGYVNILEILFTILTYKIAYRGKLYISIKSVLHIFYITKSTDNRYKKNIQKDF